jgi:DNA-binding LytR/AlgR family response regulator
MKVIIIEDELLAQAKLESMLRDIDPSIEVVAKLGSVQESKEYLLRNPAPDVAFADIQLSDDYSFEVFRNHPLQFPVVFTTAYDKYLLDSFEYNAIDYLLKPVTEEKLRKSLAKLKKLELHFLQGNFQRFLEGTSKSKDRLVVRKGTESIALRLQEVAYFYTEHKVVFARDRNGQRYMVDKTLADLEAEVDNHVFFRINRKFLANAEAIEKFRSDNGRILVFLNPPVSENIYISKETAPEFRRWIGS